MASLFADLKSLLEEDELYKVFGIGMQSTLWEVKKAYYKSSLKYHPERPGNERRYRINKKFQVLGRVYLVLSDKEKRQLYDREGGVKIESYNERRREHKPMWDKLFGHLNFGAIEDDEDRYLCSDKELADLKRFYVEYNGEMEKVLDGLDCCRSEDIKRHYYTLSSLITARLLPEFPVFNMWSLQLASSPAKKQKKRAKPAGSDDDIGGDPDSPALTSPSHSDVDEQPKHKQSTKKNADHEGSSEKLHKFRKLKIAATGEGNPDIQMAGGSDDNTVTEASSSAVSRKKDVPKFGKSQKPEKQPRKAASRAGTAGKKQLAVPVSSSAEGTEEAEAPLSSKQAVRRAGTVGKKLLTVPVSSSAEGTEEAEAPLSSKQAARRAGTVEKKQLAVPVSSSAEGTGEAEAPSASRHVPKFSSGSTKSEASKPSHTKIQKTNKSGSETPLNLPPDSIEGKDVGVKIMKVPKAAATKKWQAPTKAKCQDLEDM